MNISIINTFLDSLICSYNRHPLYYKSRIYINILTPNFLKIATSITKRIESNNSDSNDENGSRQSTQGSDILTIALEGKFGIIQLTENVSFIVPKLIIYTTQDISQN